MPPVSFNQRDVERTFKIAKAGGQRALCDEALFSRTPKVTLLLQGDQIAQLL